MFNLVVDSLSHNAIETPIPPKPISPSEQSSDVNVFHLENLDESSMVQMVSDSLHLVKE